MAHSQVLGRIVFSPELKQRVLVCSLSALDRDDTIIVLEYVVEGFLATVLPCQSPHPAQVGFLSPLTPTTHPKKLFLTLFYAKTPF